MHDMENYDYREDYRNNRGDYREDYRNNRGDYRGDYRDDYREDYRGGNYRNNYMGNYRNYRDEYGRNRRNYRGGNYRSQEYVMMLEEVVDDGMELARAYEDVSEMATENSEKQKLMKMAEREKEHYRTAKEMLEKHM